MKIEPPIKIKWTAKVRDKVHTNTEHIDELQPVFEREKTNIVFESVGEVEQFINWTESKAEYGQRTEIYTPAMKQSIQRVRDELRERLQVRFDNDDLKLDEGEKSND